MRSPPSEPKKSSDPRAFVWLTTLDRHLADLEEQLQRGELVACGRPQRQSIAGGSEPRVGTILPGPLIIEAVEQGSFSWIITVRRLVPAAEAAAERAKDASEGR